MLALFDIDGTLVSAGGAGTRALDAAFAALHGVSGAMAGIRCGGKTDPAIAAELFLAGLGRGPEGDELSALLAEYERRLPGVLRDASGFRVLPGVAAALDEVARRPGAVLGIATGNTAGGARHKLARAGLEHRFAVGGYGSDHIERPRLTARAIERACDHAGRTFGRDDVVVIGDTPFDVAAARACGVRVIAVATGPSTRAELESCDADVVIDTLVDLKAALAQLTL